MAYLVLLLSLSLVLLGVFEAAENLFPPRHLWHFPHRFFLDDMTTSQHDQSRLHSMPLSSPFWVDALIFHPPLRFPPRQWWQLPQRDLEAATRFPQSQVQFPPESRSSLLLLLLMLLLLLLLLFAALGFLVPDEAV